jgi:hypothetical protein
MGSSPAPMPWSWRCLRLNACSSTYPQSDRGCCRAGNGAPRRVRYDCGELGLVELKPRRGERGKGVLPSYLSPPSTQLHSRRLAWGVILLVPCFHPPNLSCLRLPARLRTLPLRSTRNSSTALPRPMTNTMSVTFLGTSAGKPCATRNVSCLALALDNKL